MLLSFLVFLAATLLLGAMFLVSKQQSGYSHRTHTISELGESGHHHTGLVSYGIFLPVGLVCALGAASLALNTGLDELSLGGTILGASLATGYILSAFFPCDPGSPLHGSRKQALHNLGGTIEYLGGAAAIWIIGHGLIQQYHDTLWGTLFKIDAALVLSAFMLLAFPNHWRGAVQRVAEFILFCDFLLVGWMLFPV